MQPGAAGPQSLTFRSAAQNQANYAETHTQADFLKHSSPFLSWKNFFRSAAQYHLVVPMDARGFAPHRRDAWATINNFQAS
jgi:hypothetical protein